MNTEEQTEQLKASLRKEIESISGREMKTPKDFTFLSEEIFRTTHKHLSDFTLKRFWGYIDRGSCNTSTLNILADFAGYGDWKGYVNSVLNNEGTSGPLTDAFLTVRALKVGAMIRLRWSPDRIVDVRYLGDERLQVVESVNSKLTVGDVYKCNAIVANQPLILHRQLAEEEKNASPKNDMYVCGKRSGVTFCLLSDDLEEA